MAEDRVAVAEHIVSTRRYADRVGVDFVEDQRRRKWFVAIGYKLGVNSDLVKEEVLARMAWRDWDFDEAPSTFWLRASTAASAVMTARLKIAALVR